MEVLVTVRKKIPYVPRGLFFVGENNNLVVRFDFDEEWSEYEYKTARAIIGTVYTDIEFTGDTIELPLIPSSVKFIDIGLFAGSLTTTHPARIPVVVSILALPPGEPIIIPGNPEYVPPATDVEADDALYINDVSEGKWVNGTIQDILNLAHPNVVFDDDTDGLVPHPGPTEVDDARTLHADGTWREVEVPVFDYGESGLVTGPETPVSPESRFLRADGGWHVVEDNVFIADYGVTTYAEIQSALEESKAVICRKSETVDGNTFVHEGILAPETHYATVYRFNAYPMKFAVSNHDVWSTGSWLDDTVDTSDQAVTSHAVYTALQGVTGAFWATYGVTTAAEVRAAIAAQKPVFVIHNDDFYRLESTADVDFVFTSIDSKGIKLSSYDVWSEFVAADTVPTEDSERLITSGGVFDALQDKQDVLTFDDDPTEGSSNPVTSDGIYAALQNIDTSDLVDPTLTIAGKAADAEVVGEKFNELMREVWDYNIPVPDADITVYPRKNINSRNNMVDNDSYTCIAFVVPETGHYKMTVSSSSQLVFFIYDEETFTSEHFVRRVANEDALEGVLLDAGEVLLARAFSTTFTMSANYATAATVTLNPALPLTTAQDEQMRGYINAELDDVLANGYQHLDGEWARHGWRAYDSVDRRDFRVRYTGDVVFNRDVQIVAAAGFCVAGYLEDGTAVSARSVFELPKGTKAHIYMRRWAEDISEVADVAEFAAACSISTCIADIERYSDTFTDVSMFVRVGVCGDSYASGGGIISGIRPLTWGKNLERQGGVTVDIYAKSGQDVREWVANEKNGLPKLLASPECGLYWLQHGHNGTSTAADVGTPEDMSTIPHPYTFYGQYTEAIEQIKATFPNARIVLATVTGSSFSLYESLYKNVNIAIRNIAAYCEVPCIEVIDDDFYKSNWYDASMRSTHPTAMLSAGMAAANCRLIARCIEANPAYFVDYGSNNYSVTGKGLSTNDYTDADKAKVDSIVPLGDVYTKTETDTLLSGKQNTLTWDTTPTAGSLNPVTSNGIYAALETKVDKVTGKGLSANDYTNIDKAKVDAMPTATSDLTNDSDFQTGTEVNDAIAAALGSMTSLQYAIVTELPATGAAGTVYLIQNGLSYDQYMWIGGQFYNIGSTAIDLSGYYTIPQTDTLLAAKQDALNFDAVPTVLSTNPVTSGGVFEALADKQDALTFDNVPTFDSQNPVTSNGLYLALQGKQNALTFDSVPTDGSNNPVTSNGVYDALSTKQNVLTFDNEPTIHSDNPAKSGGIYTALLSKQNVLTFDERPTRYSANPVTSNGIWEALQGSSPADIQQMIDDAIAGITEFDYMIVSVLPATGEKGVVYFVPNAQNPAVYDKYLWIDGTPAGHYESIGSTEVDLSDYCTKTEVDDLIDDVRIFEAQLNVTSAADIIQAVNDRKSIVVHSGAGSPSEFAVKAAISGEKVYLYTMTLNVGSPRSYPVFTRHVIEGTTWAVTNVGGAVTDDVPFIAEQGRTTPPQIEMATAKNRIIVVKTTGGEYYPCINVSTTADYHTRLHCLAGSYDATATTYALALKIYDVYGATWTEYSTAMVTAADLQEAVDDLNDRIDEVEATIGRFRGNYGSYALLAADSRSHRENDYAIVTVDETHANQCWYYTFSSDSVWVARFKIRDAAFTTAQLNAINSGATTAKIDSIALKNDKITTYEQSTIPTDSTKFSCLDGNNNQNNLRWTMAQMFQYFWNKTWDKIYPVGSIYTTTDKDFNPATSFGGTWSHVGVDRVLWGVSTSTAGGSTLSEQLPDIRGHIDWSTGGQAKTEISNGSGAFSLTNKNLGAAYPTGAGASNSARGFDFKASDYNSVYKLSGVVRPNAYTVHFWRRTA